MKSVKNDTIISFISYKQAMLTKVVAWLVILCFTINSVTYGYDGRGLDNLRSVRDAESESIGAKIEAHMHEDDDKSNNAPQRNNDDAENTPSKITRESSPEDEEIRKSIEGGFLGSVDPWLQGVISEGIKIHRYKKAGREKSLFGTKYELLCAISVAAARTYKYLCNSGSEFIKTMAGEDVRLTLKLYQDKFPYLNGTVVVGDDENVLRNPQSIHALNQGDILGNGTGDMMAFVDVIEKIGGVHNASMPDSTSFAVYAKGGKILTESSQFYMNKIIVGAEARDCGIDVRFSVAENVDRIRRALKKELGDLRCAILLRPRHYRMINELCSALGCNDIPFEEKDNPLVENIKQEVEAKGFKLWGDRIYLLNDGDVMATCGLFTPPDAENHIDFAIGAGGYQEGMISAAIVKCLGGQMSAHLASKAKLNPQIENVDLQNHCRKSRRRHFSKEELEMIQVTDPMRVRNAGELIESDDIVVTATAIKDSIWLPDLAGLMSKGQAGSPMVTHSLWIDSSGEMFVCAIPYQTRIPELLRRKQKESNPQELARINYELACAYAMLGARFQTFAENCLEEALSVKDISEKDRLKYMAVVKVMEGLNNVRVGYPNETALLIDIKNLLYEAFSSIDVDVDENIDIDDVEPIYTEIGFILGTLSHYLVHIRNSHARSYLNWESRSMLRHTAEECFREIRLSKYLDAHRKSYEVLASTDVTPENYRKKKLISVLLPVYTSDKSREEIEAQLNSWIDSVEQDLKKLPSDYDYEILVCLNKHTKEAADIVCEALGNYIKRGVKITILETEPYLKLDPKDRKRNCKISALDAMYIELCKRRKRLKEFLGEDLIHYIHCSDDDIELKLTEGAGDKPKEKSNIYLNIERLERNRSLDALSCTPLAHKIGWQEFRKNPLRSFIKFINNCRRFRNYGVEAEVEQLYGGGMTMHFEKWPPEGIREFGYDDCYLSCYFGITDNEGNYRGSYKKAVTTNWESEMYHDDPDTLIKLTNRMVRDAREAAKLEQKFTMAHGGADVFKNYDKARKA
ncbi:MAG: fructose-bisphosphatase class II, partial [Candidatus Omnitrophica bacterium]|nr:fructose-bisphosphatase class II [Candidatus Omnitrophota bacterium]